MSASRTPCTRELRTVAALATLFALLLPLGLAAPAVAAGKGPKPGAFKGGSLIQDGWWARTNEPPPETGVLQPPGVPALAAPEGNLLVALINGDPERIAALEFGLKGDDDSIVTEVLLVMAESEERGANVNADQAALQACPVTEPSWVGVDNGAWKTAPLYDCEAGVAPGVRDDKGVWTFDLTALAAGWVSSDRVDSPAVVLVGAPPIDPAQGSPSFQVAFDGESGIGLAAKVTSLPPEDLDGDSEPDSGGSTDEGAPAAGGTDTSSGGSGSFGGGGTGGAISGGGPLDTGSSGSLPPPDSSGVPGAGSEELPEASGGFTAETGSNGGSQALSAALAPPPWYSGLGVRSVALAVVALLLAYLVMLAMGGAAQPVVGTRRRGVGRALERLRATRNPVITLEDRT